MGYCCIDNSCIIKQEWSVQHKPILDTVNSSRHQEISIVDNPSLRGGDWLSLVKTRAGATHQCNWLRLRIKYVDAKAVHRCVIRPKQKMAAASSGSCNTSEWVDSDQCTKQTHSSKVWDYFTIKGSDSVVWQLCKMKMADHKSTTAVHQAASRSSLCRWQNTVSFLLFTTSIVSPFLVCFVVPHYITQWFITFYYHIITLKIIT